ncbi:MAG: hypothetical protein JWN44_2313 [Myxococcales bacterium]|nr:hypothetical protein [Myxococcales bacterium]
MTRALAILVVICGLARAAAAQDAFEIQVYDSEIAPPAGTGLEIHLNHVAVGSKVRSADGQLPSDRVTHLTFEPHVGLARWCEAGAYLQTALRPDSSFDYAGVKLRWKAHIPRRRRGFGFALNLEVASIPHRYETVAWGSEVRPIIDFEWKWLYASVNPILGFDFEGPDAGIPHFGPAATVMVRAVEGWYMGVEYYAEVPDVHRLFAVSTIVHKWFGLHVGAGYGLGAGDKWIVKSILTFDLPR